MEDGSETISITEIKKFVIDCFITIGVSKTYSEIMAEAIVGADIIGHESHGVFRLDKFLEDGMTGKLDIHGVPKIEKETCSTAWVDGKNAFGPIVGNFCMKIAIGKARATGAAIVVANNSNNFGVASHYNQQALNEGMIGLVLTNSSALMLPTRAKYALCGTNPISFTAPGLLGDYFLLDMATTVTSGGNVAIRCETSKYLPFGWAANAACIHETDAEVALKAGRFLPLGSYEEAGSYKGTGLSIMIDILCGILGGASYSTMVGIWTNQISRQKGNIGQCFIVINPKYFAPNFEVRMSQLMTSIRNVEPVDPNNPVRVAGDKGRLMAEIIKESGGIKYPKFIINSIEKLSEQLKLKRVSYIPKKKPVKKESLEELAPVEAVRKVSLPEERIEVESLEEDLFERVHSKDEVEISYMVQDSSDWLCSFTYLTEEQEKLGKKKKKLITVVSEKISKRSAYTQHMANTARRVIDDNRPDEILETRKND